MKNVSVGAPQRRAQLPPEPAGTSSSLEQFGYKQELRRALSPFDLLIYGLAVIGPFSPVSVFGIVFNMSHGMVPLVYLLGLLAMIFTALSYMAMTRVFPLAGSVYTYAARALGPTLGFFAGWAILLDYLLLPTLIYVACSIALHSVLPGVPSVVWVIGLLALATAVNFAGIEATARVNWIMLGLQMLLLLAFLATGAVALAHHVDGAHLSFAPFYRRSEPIFRLGFGALSLAALSFLGFDAISTLSEESRDGARAVSRATMWSLCLCAGCFVAETWLASLFVLGRTSLPPGDATNAAFYDIAGAIGGAWLKFLVTVPGAVCAWVGSLAAQAATMRLIFGMARDGKLPRALAHVHRTRDIPDRALLVTCAVALVLGVWMVSRFELLTSLVNFGALLGFLLLHVSVIVHFRRERSPNWLRHLVAPAIGVGFIGYVLWNAEADAKTVGLCWLGVGGVVLIALRLRNRLTALPDAR